MLFIQIEDNLKSVVQIYYHTYSRDRHPVYRLNNGQ